MNQVWHADDATGVGKLSQLYNWWNQICDIGPGHGYFSNAAKTWLVTKEAYHSEAIAIFEGTGVKITSEGHPHLGSAIGTLEFTQQYVASKIDKWCKEIEVLTAISKSLPHATFTVLTHSLAENGPFSQELSLK